MNERELQILHFSVKNIENYENPIPTRNFLLKYPSLLSALWAGSMVGVRGMPERDIGSLGVMGKGAGGGQEILPPPPPSPSSHPLPP